MLQSNGLQFSWLSFIVFIIAMCIYTYYLIIDYRSNDSNDRDPSEVTWIWINFTFLLVGILVSGYFVYTTNIPKISSEPPVDKKSALLREPFSKLPEFIGNKLY